jgi:NADH-quinone oxidoreductase subunit H
MPSYLPSLTDKTPTPIDRVIRDPRRLLPGAAVALILPIPLIAGLYIAFTQQVQAVLGSQFWFSVIMMALSLFLIIHLCAACILAERKISAYIQDRLGPNRVGWGGLLQPIADGVKFILKEEVIPVGAEKPIFILAPCLAFIISLLGFAIIPWAGEIVWPWTDASGHAVKVTTQVAPLDIGVLYMLAVGSLSVYGVVLAGWASNNKYAHFGGMRATAQMLSYEVPLGLGLLVIILAAGTLRLEEIVNQQAFTGIWNVFVHPVAFLLVLIAAFAETNRAPFDLAECEHELIAGFHTEYSSMKFALFFLGEYAHMVTASAFVVAIFLGGWSLLPGYDPLAGVDTWWAALIKFHIFWGKVLALIVFYMLIRWTLPRFRFDQLMRISWKGLVPIGMVMVLATILLTAFGVKVDATKGFFGNLGYLGITLTVNLIVIAAAIWFVSAAKSPVTGRQENLPDVKVLPARLT